MITLIARLKLRGRRNKTVYVGGLFWRLCNHRSHGWGFKCRRWHVYDGFCARHNMSCFSGCAHIPIPENWRTRGRRR